MHAIITDAEWTPPHGTARQVRGRWIVVVADQFALETEVAANAANVDVILAGPVSDVRDELENRIRSWLADKVLNADGGTTLQDVQGWRADALDALDALD